MPGSFKEESGISKPLRQNQAAVSLIRERRIALIPVGHVGAIRAVLPCVMMRGATIAIILQMRQRI